MKLMVVEPFHWSGSLLARGSSLVGADAEKIAASAALRRKCVLVAEPAPAPSVPAVAPDPAPVKEGKK